MTEPQGDEPGAEVYPRAPLGAVAIEVYFPPLLDAFERLGRFQRAHASEYDHLVLPDELDTPTLRRRRAATLVHANRHRALAVGRDMVAAVTYAYPEGYPGFVAWALPLLREVLDNLDAKLVERVRYVYENEINLDHDNGDVELGSMLQLRVPRGHDSSTGLAHIHMFWTQNWPAGGVDVRLNCCDKSMEAGTLDLGIAATCGGRFATDALEPHIAEAHRMARATFESLITPEYREHLRSRSDA